MKKFLLYILLVLILVVLVGGSVYIIWRIYKTRPLPSSPKNQVSQEEKKAQRAEEEKTLIENIKDTFNIQSPGTSLAIGVYDLNNNDYFGDNDTISQHAASTSKVITATYIYDQAEKGKTDLNKVIGLYNIETQIKFLVNVSSEDSWQLIDAEFKPEDQNKYAQSLGLQATDLNFGKNVTSAKDITILLKKLAKGEILNQANRGKLFSYMQKTESEDLFSPAFMEAKIPFYHKTGKYEGEAHDAAIVQHPKNPFVLVILTDNKTDTNLIGRGTVMTKAARMVLEYFDEL